MPGSCTSGNSVVTCLGRLKVVIMVAHAFPPEGNAGVYRTLRFVRHLPTKGWSPSVVSANMSSYERHDPELLQLVPSSTEVIRVTSCDPWQSIQTRRAQRIQKRLSDSSLKGAVRLPGPRLRPVLREAVRRAEAWCYHPDMAMGWIRPATDATVNMAARKQADVIWATAGPVSSFIVAERASLRTGVPYVLDFRDAWTITYNDFDARRPAWATLTDRRRLHRLLAGAQAVTFRYHAEAECYWRAYPGALDVFRIHIIPNGYEGSIEESAIPNSGDRCTVLYAGTLSSYRYDTLLRAVRWLKESDPARAARLRLHFVGEGMEALATEAAILGVSDLVETRGPTSHGEIARLQREAHAVLVLGRPPTMKGHELFAGAKLFSYLKAGRPIVGVLPSDETKRILHRVGVSTVADGDSSSEIVAMFQRLLDAWSAGTLHSLVPNPVECDAYSAERQTAALACALEGKPAKNPFVPNSVEVPLSLRWEIAAMRPATTPAGTQRRDGNVFLRP